MTPNVVVLGLTGSNLIEDWRCEYGLEAGFDNAKYIKHFKAWKDILLCPTRTIEINVTHPFYPTQEKDWLKYSQLLDGDIFIADDSISWKSLATSSQFTHDYFSRFLKVTRMAASNLMFCDLDSFMPNQCDVHGRTILESMWLSSMTIMSPYAKHLVFDKLYDYYKAPVLEKLEASILELCPPDMYKIRPTFEAKDFSTLKALWSHRLAETKHFDLFVKMVIEVSKHIPIDVKVTIQTDADRIHAESQIPEDYIDIFEFVPFAHTHDEYQQYLNWANCTFATSSRESWGISVLDLVKTGSLVFGLNHNDAYKFIIGDKYLYDVDDINTSFIHDFLNVVKDPKEHLEYNQQRYNKAVPTFNEYQSIVNDEMFNLFNTHLDNLIVHPFAPTLKRYITEAQQPVPRHLVFRYVLENYGVSTLAEWGDIYYSLRKLGISVNEIDGKLFY